MPEPTTTIQIYKSDRERLREYGGFAADAINALINACNHPEDDRQYTALEGHFIGEAAPRKLSGYSCKACGKFILRDDTPAQLSKAKKN